MLNLLVSVKKYLVINLLVMIFVLCFIRFGWGFVISKILYLTFGIKIYNQNTFQLVFIWVTIAVFYTIYNYLLHELKGANESRRFLTIAILYFYFLGPLCIVDLFVNWCAIYTLLCSFFVPKLVNYIDSLKGGDSETDFYIY